MFGQVMQPVDRCNQSKVRTNEPSISLGPLRLTMGFSTYHHIASELHPYKSLSWLVKPTYLHSHKSYHILPTSKSSTFIGFSIIINDPFVQCGTLPITSWFVSWFVNPISILMSIMNHTSWIYKPTWLSFGAPHCGVPLLSETIIYDQMCPQPGTKLREPIPRQMPRCHRWMGRRDHGYITGYHGIQSMG